MRRLLLALLLAGTVAHAHAQVRELSSVVRPLDGSTVGDVTSVAVTATSPITGTSTCTGGACSFTLGLAAPGAGSELVYRSSGTALGAALGSAVTAGTGAITLTSQGAAVTPLTIVPHASQTAPLILFSTDTGLARESAGLVKVTDGGAGSGGIDFSKFRANWNSSGGMNFNYLNSGALRMGSDVDLRWTSGAQSAPHDVGIYRASAGIVGITGGTGTASPSLGSIQAGNYTATALATPTITPPLTVNGTPGATTYGYKAVAFLNDGTSSAASAEVTIATGPATLNATDNITVATPAVANMAYYNLYRTTGGAAPPKLIYSGTTPSYIDTGTEISAETPATKNTTGYAVAARAKITGLASYANNAAALAAGLVAGDLYTITGSDPLALAVVY